MIVDSSAIIAILYGEPDSERLAEMVGGSGAKMSAANWLEAAMVLDGNADPDAGDKFDRLIDASVEIVPVTVEQARRARVAFRRYGRGSGSPARLNYGDCFAYALASELGEPLLFKGDDFPHTDVERA